MKKLIILLMPLFALFPNLSLGGGGRTYLETGAGYKTGDFGTPVRTNLYYLAPVLGYVTPSYNFSLTVPYLFLSSGTDTGIDTGAGDVIIRGGTTLIPELGSGASVDGTLAVKLPTADETKGLGTGKTDVGSFLTVTQELGAIKMTLGGGFIKLGDPPGQDYNDIYLYDIGIYTLVRKTGLYTSLEGRTASVQGAKNPLEVNIGFIHALNSFYMLKGDTFFGFNKGGPDFGTSIGVVRWF
ncbi:MAG: hypothetical protein HZA08_11630 [Nitrospirae bacterium]|nr:hypothetical protein [Nitrospirota bacterium]